MCILVWLLSHQNPSLYSVFSNYYYFFFLNIKHRLCRRKLEKYWYLKISFFFFGRITRLMLLPKKRKNCWIYFVWNSLKKFQFIFFFHWVDVSIFSSQLDVLQPMVEVIVVRPTVVQEVLMFVPTVLLEVVQILCSMLPLAMIASNDLLLVVQLLVLQPFDVY